MKKQMQGCPCQLLKGHSFNVGRFTDDIKEDGLTVFFYGDMSAMEGVLLAYDPFHMCAPFIIAKMQNEEVTFCCKQSPTKVGNMKLPYVKYDLEAQWWTNKFEAGEYVPDDFFTVVARVIVEEKQQVRGTL